MEMEERDAVGEGGVRYRTSHECLLYIARERCIVRCAKEPVVTKLIVPMARERCGNLCPCETGLVRKV